MSESVCPWWLGYLLASPLRRLMQNPEQILSPYVQSGMTVVDIGSAMGFFTLPLARMVGQNGRVFAVDVQEKMLSSLITRAKRAGLSDRITPSLCSTSTLGLGAIAGQADFALAFAVIHEIPQAANTMREAYASLKPGARFLIAEPKGHVSPIEFEKTVEAAKACGFQAESSPEIARSHAILLFK